MKWWQQRLVIVMIQLLERSLPSVGVLGSWNRAAFRNKVRYLTLEGRMELRKLGKCEDTDQTSPNLTFRQCRIQGKSDSSVPFSTHFL